MPTFEALLALTNLASADDDPLRESIIRVCWADVEALLLSRNVLVQRAAVDLVCNLQASPQGVMKFADGSWEAKQRLQILLALGDSEDLATRRAAGGAVAMLTEWDKAAEAVVGIDRGIGILLGMCGVQEGQEMQARGLVALGNLASVPDGETQKKAIEGMKREDGVEVLKELLKGSRDQQILGMGVEVLKKLI